ncbi:MAG: type II toxin-antitoxin system MqsR family toxin [Spirochaetia bacterium]|jgi:hypothetical protein|nr:type II toxin-antitoxin system MqsR family toxin [Spirochaetia bacterium]
MRKGFKEQLIHINLGKIKDAVKKKRAIFIETSKNAKTLFDHNLSTSDVYRILVELTEEDYYKGPEDDHDGSAGYIWVFLHPVSGCKMYIKLKLFSIEQEEYVKILSFHE